MWCLAFSIVLFLSVNKVVYGVAIISSDDLEDDKKCHCETEVNLTIPPCVCTGHYGIIKENIELKEKLSNCKTNSSFGDEELLDGSASQVFVAGEQWTRFWWYDPVKSKGWPSDVKDVLGVPYGTCHQTDINCFSRLPLSLSEADSELLAIDTAGSIYRWKFDPSNPISHAVWRAFYNHIELTVINSKPWNPQVIKGPKYQRAQDSFMYRIQNGVKSLLLDDDNCDCLSTLSMGHGMCGTGFSNSYGPAGRFGVDLLYDTHCQTPDPQHGLSLYFKDSSNENL